MDGPGRGGQGRRSPSRSELCISKLSWAAPIHSLTLLRPNRVKGKVLPWRLNTEAVERKEAEGGRPFGRWAIVGRSDRHCPSLRRRKKRFVRLRVEAGNLVWTLEVSDPLHSSVPLFCRIPLPLIPRRAMHKKCGKNKIPRSLRPPFLFVLRCI